MSEDGSELESSVEGFVDLEAELTSATGGTYEAGTVSGGSKVAAGEVPDGYPVTIDTDHALRLDVQTDDGATLETYLPWPEPGSEADAVSRLLDALGLEADEFANVYGERVALEAVEGWHRVDVAGTSEDGGDGWGGSGGGGLDVGESEAAASSADATPSADTAFGSAAGDDDADVSAFLAPAAAAVMGFAWVFGGMSDVAFVVASGLFLVSLVAIPASLVYSTYVTEERGGWDPYPVLWGALGALPVVNVPVVAAYLLEWVARGRPVHDRPGTSIWGVVVGTLLSVAPLALLFVVGPEAASGGTVAVFVATGWVYSTVLLPMAMFFDSGHVDEAGAWDPTKPVWVAGAVVASLLFVSGWLVGLAYLAKRYLEVG